jgi:hypothetical protein
MLYISKTKNLLLEFFLYLTSIQRYQLPIFFYHAFRGHLYTGVPELPLQRKKGVCTGRQCHFKIWLDCHKLKNFPA